MKISLLFAALTITASMALADGYLGDAPANLIAVNDDFNARALASDAQGLIDLYADDTLWIEQGAPVRQGLGGLRALFEFVTSNKGKGNPHH